MKKIRSNRIKSRSDRIER